MRRPSASGWPTASRPWPRRTACRGRAHRLYNRSGYTHGPELPANAIESRAGFDRELYNLQRLYMANRGVWDAIEMAGPACGIRTTAADVDRYLGTLDDFLEQVRPDRRMS